MCSQTHHTTLRGWSFTALFLVVLICAFLLPFIGNAEGGGGEVPYPAPPPPDGEGQTIPDTTFITQGGEDSSLFYLE